MKTIEVGGNKLLLNMGNRLGRIADRLKKRGHAKTDKYQLVHQGDFKVKFKEATKSDNAECPIEENELFIIIETYQKSWFLKNKDLA